jgi:hypothetical protein
MPSVATAPRGTGLISAPRQAEDGLPYFAFIPTHARHHCALPLFATEALSVSATFVHRSDPTLPHQALPSPRGARLPQPRRPQPLPRAPVACSPPLPFLRELTDNRPFRPSPGPIPTSVSTTSPRSTSTLFQLRISLASPTPHRRSPTPTAITVVSQALVTPSSSNSPIGCPLAPARTPTRPSPVARHRPAGIGRQAASFGFPYFGRGPKRASGPNPLAGPGQAPLWAKPTATVPIFIFCSNYSNLILIKVQTSKIVGNCM